MNQSDFIQQNRFKPLPEIALLLSKHSELDASFILAQINGIQKAKNKLPEFYNTPNILYPSKLSMEQCSSEQTAVYKTHLLLHSEKCHPEHVLREQKPRRIISESIIDLTGGFGIDSFYFAKQFKQVTYVEQNAELFEVVKSNFESLKVDNIKLINSTAENFISNTKQKADVIYIDPSRRNENQRVFKLDECTPNIIELAASLFTIANKILLKTAPLLDIKQSLKDLKKVTNVWVISVDNDCKEVLYLLKNGTSAEPQIHTMNLIKNKTPLLRGVGGVLKEQTFDFNYKKEQAANVEYAEPKNYLYEPNASILKAGAFKSICNEFNVEKLAPNTHLYTSEKLIKSFPGRSFKIEKTINYNPKYFKIFGIIKANVSCRNFKDSVEQVKKKLNLKDGGETYLFAITDLNNKPILIICVK